MIEVQDTIPADARKLRCVEALVEYVTECKE